MKLSDTYFDFELQYRPEDWKSWSSTFEGRWLGVPIAICYVFVIFGIKWAMEKKERWELKKALILWNFGLAVFSWWGSLRMVPYWWDLVSSKGVDFTLCDDSVYRNPVTSFWICLFVWSKIFELFDTVFVVLRKQRLIFLHWYHHATVVFLSFANWHAWPGIGIWQTTMNFSVHSIMYSFYMVRAMGFKPPKIINMIITSLQIFQMIIACLFGARTFFWIISGSKCGTDNIYTSGLAFGIYFSYLILFLQFFQTTYFSRSRTLKKID